MGSLTITNTLKAISDDKSLALFNTVALGSGNASALITRLELTKKQYYSRMSELIKASLLIRQNGSYLLTSFGKVVYEAQVLIGRAVENYWKLNGIDSIKMLPIEERKRIIDTLIDNNSIKNIILGYNSRNTASAEKDNQELIFSAPSKTSSIKMHT
jgi:hypothetical protein